MGLGISLACLHSSPYAFSLVPVYSAHVLILVYAATASGSRAVPRSVAACPPAEAHCPSLPVACYLPYACTLTTIRQDGLCLFLCEGHLVRRGLHLPCALPRHAPPYRSHRAPTPPPWISAARGRTAFPFCAHHALPSPCRAGRRARAQRHDSKQTFSHAWTWCALNNGQTAVVLLVHAGRWDKPCAFACPFRAPPPPGATPTTRRVSLNHGVCLLVQALLLT